MLVFSLLAIAVILYQALVSRFIIENVLKVLPDPVWLLRGRSVRERESLYVLAVASFAQLVFAGLLSVVLHPSIDCQMTGRQFVLAAVLGVGEVGIAVVLGASIDVILPWIRSRQESDESRAVLAKSGWMRHFVALRQASLVAWVCISTLYVCGEELIYRALCLRSVAHLGAVESIALTSALFVAIQVFHMPSWRAALNPIIGASVVGPFHAWLFLQQAQITPLVVAGTTCLLMTMGLVTPPSHLDRPMTKISS
jgi:Type II CAAX prenyl endopeptidase Rce1-like